MTKFAFPITGLLDTNGKDCDEMLRNAQLAYEEDTDGFYMIRVVSPFPKSEPHFIGGCVQLAC